VRIFPLSPGRCCVTHDLARPCSRVKRGAPGGLRETMDSKIGTAVNSVHLSDLGPQDGVSGRA
jgi:hypothetical protein